MLFNNPQIEPKNRHLPSDEITTMLSPGGEDDNEDMDWSDIDDEDFEDMAEDKDDYHQIQLDNDLFDPEDDDHLPDDDD